MAMESEHTESGIDSLAWSPWLWTKGSCSRWPWSTWPRTERLEPCSGTRRRKSYRKPTVRTVYYKGSSEHFGEVTLGEDLRVQVNPSQEPHPTDPRRVEQDNGIQQWLQVNKAVVSSHAQQWLQANWAAVGSVAQHWFQANRAVAGSGLLPEHLKQADNSDEYTWDQAMASPHREKFLIAAQEEIDQLTEHGTWHKDLKKNATTRILPFTWVFKIKRNSDRKITKFKARLCTRGDLEDSTCLPVLQTQWLQKCPGFDL